MSGADNNRRSQTMNTTPTIDQITGDDNFLCGINLTDQQTSCYLLYNGGDKLKYYCFHKDALLFEGVDFKPSPLFEPDSLASIVHLLYFLTTRPGDTDREFFSNYTQAQMQWTESPEIEELSLLLSDFFIIDDENKEYHTDAVNKLKEAYIS